jgi:agmatinase
MTRPFSFLSADLPLDRARVVIFGVPLERTLTFRGGTAQAPTAIRTASDSLESYSAFFRQDIAEIGLADLGDVDPHAPLGEILCRVEGEVARMLRAGKAPLLLGGEHTIALGAVRGARSASGEIQVLALDAHSDLRDEYLGERISHATVLRRCAELSPHLVIVGARSFFAGEIAEPFFADLRSFAERLDPKLPLWLTLDLDVLDPALCPGVTNPEPGGLSYQEVIQIFQKLRGFPVVGMDISELAPPFDPSGVSAITAAKLVIEAVCAFWGQSPKKKLG